MADLTRCSWMLKWKKYLPVPVHATIVPTSSMWRSSSAIRTQKTVIRNDSKIMTAIVSAFEKPAFHFLYSPGFFPPILFFFKCLPHQFDGGKFMSWCAEKKTNHVDLKAFHTNRFRSFSLNIPFCSPVASNLKCRVWLLLWNVLPCDIHRHSNNPFLFSCSNFHTANIRFHQPLGGFDPIDWYWIKTAMLSQRWYKIKYCFFSSFFLNKYWDIRFQRYFCMPNWFVICLHDHNSMS